MFLCSSDRDTAYSPTRSMPREKPRFFLPAFLFVAIQIERLSHDRKDQAKCSITDNDRDKLINNSAKPIIIPLSGNWQSNRSPSLSLFFFFLSLESKRKWLRKIDEAKSSWVTVPWLLLIRKTERCK